MSGPDKERWKQVFEDELNSLKANSRQENPGSMPKGRRILPGRWVLASKIGAEEMVARWKTSWEAEGYRQKERVYFNETYSSVTKSERLRILLALGAKYDYEIGHNDVSQRCHHRPPQSAFKG